ncbi:MAG: anti-sigma factor [Bacteroidota bacterium]
MNVQEYISSGAIEACVMGLADEQDWIELEQMSALYPEVKQYKEHFELEQEQLHLGAALTPPTALKQRIFESLAFETEERIEAPVIDLQEKIIPAKPMVIPMVPTPKPMKWLQRAVAVCVLMLMASIILNFYFYSRSVSFKKQYTALVVQQNSLLARNKAMEASFNMVKDPAVKQVVMGATPAKPGSMATVYWDSRSKDVYLLVNNLPKPASQKQYQLWAIVDGKPVDAGMVDLSGSQDNMLLRMRNIPEAQAFAITLEKEGGSSSPTMEAMYVLGKV